jgi:hypothetical protein
MLVGKINDGDIDVVVDVMVWRRKIMLWWGGENVYGVV